VSALRVVELAAGVVVVLLTLYDFFEAVVLPRPAVARFSPGLVLQRGLWRGWRWLGTRRADVAGREALLATFGPLSVLIMLVLRGTALVLGYALILHAVRDQIQPRPESFGTTMYFAATCLTTLGLGDIYPTGGVARAIAIIEAATGLGLVASVITLLFLLFQAFQRREVAVVTLDALAGAPPSGVTLLERCKQFEMLEGLERTFEEWRGWSAEVLESHLAYPTLLYFRSSHDNEAWLNSFGAVMDAAALVITCVEGCPRGPAHLMVKVGGHLVEDLAWRGRYAADGLPWVEREDFDEAVRRLQGAGYCVPDADRGWVEFTRLRGTYASPLIALARWLAIAPAPWIGDRSYLPHAGRVTR
jgi:Ion channel